MFLCEHGAFVCDNDERDSLHLLCLCETTFRRNVFLVCCLRVIATLLGITKLTESIVLHLNTTFVEVQHFDAEKLQLPSTTTKTTLSSPLPENITPLADTKYEKLLVKQNETQSAKINLPTAPPFTSILLRHPISTRDGKKASEESFCVLHNTTGTGVDKLKNPNVVKWTVVPE